MSQVHSESKNASLSQFHFDEKSSVPTEMVWIKLDAETNSSDPIPDYALCNKLELDSLIAQYSDLWDENRPDVLDVRISTLPACNFYSEDGEIWDEEPEWEQILTCVGKSSVELIFVHRNSGHELFFSYRH